MFNTYQVTDMQNRRILKFFRGDTALSSKVITDLYNRKYPPLKHEELTGQLLTERKILDVLVTLVKEGLIKEYADQFTSVASPQFVLIQKGRDSIQKKR